MSLKFLGKINIDSVSIKKLQQSMIEELSKRVSEKIAHERESIVNILREKIKVRLFNSPEIQSILEDNGTLRVELGLEDNIDIVNSLIDDIVKNIKISFVKHKMSTSINVVVSLKLAETYEDLFTKPYASYESEKGSKIEWLRWLLEAGNADIIFNYRIKYKPAGRLGQAIMVQSKTAHWRVPAQFSGSVNDNFITRALENIEQDLNEFVGQLL